MPCSHASTHRHVRERVHKHALTSTKHASTHAITAVFGHKLGNLFAHAGITGSELPAFVLQLVALGHGLFTIRRQTLQLCASHLQNMESTQVQRSPTQWVDSVALAGETPRHLNLIDTLEPRPGERQPSLPESPTATHVAHRELLNPREYEPPGALLTLQETTEVASRLLGSDVRRFRTFRKRRTSNPQKRESYIVDNPRFPGL